MCVYILRICIQCALGFVNKIVQRCVGIWVYTYTVVWLCVYHWKHGFDCWNNAWFEIWFNTAAMIVFVSFFHYNSVCLANGKHKVLHNFIWPASYFVWQAEVNIILMYLAYWLYWCSIIFYFCNDLCLN